MAEFLEKPVDFRILCDKMAKLVGYLKFLSETSIADLAQQPAMLAAQR